MTAPVPSQPPPGDESRYAKGGIILAPPGSVAPLSELQPDECFVRFPDDDDATWAPCIRRDTPHLTFGCPGGMTVPARSSLHRVLRDLNGDEA